MTTYHTSSSYQELFDHTRTVMAQYGLDYLMDGYDSELINILLGNHFEKVRDTVTYDDVLLMFNQGVSEHLASWISVGGFMKVENFIKQGDCERLYSIYTCWRNKLMEEEDSLFRIKLEIQLPVSTDGERVL